MPGECAKRGVQVWSALHRNPETPQTASPWNTAEPAFARLKATSVDGQTQRFDGDIQKPEYDAHVRLPIAFARMDKLTARLYDSSAVRHQGGL